VKVQLDMELADVLRISVLLDHHNIESREAADVSVEPVATLYKNWGTEAAELNRKLLAAVARRASR
jgi:hypothetical protein